MNTGVSVHDRIQIRKWADERAAQDDERPTETNDAGRDLARWPHGWYIPVAAGAVVVACLLVLVFREWQALGGTLH